MSDCIFVYGSLLSGIAHPMGERLRREAEMVGTATVRGSLYKVSWYPAVTLGGSASVQGEVYQLSDPVQTLAWLDEYEGITPGPTGVAAADEYERVIASVTLDNGRDADAWIYVYRRAVDGLQHVASGRWAG